MTIKRERSGEGATFSFRIPAAWSRGSYGKTISPAHGTDGPSEKFNCWLESRPLIKNRRKGISVRAPEGFLFIPLPFSLSSLSYCSFFDCRKNNQLQFPSSDETDPPKIFIDRPSNTSLLKRKVISILRNVRRNQESDQSFRHLLRGSSKG